MPNALDGLLVRIHDPALRSAIESEVGRLRETKDFGLVFERHLPESVRLYSYQVKRGARVQERKDDSDRTWLVRRIKGGNAVVVDDDGLKNIRPVSELVVVREFGESIYPGFNIIGEVLQGGDKPVHTIINGENFHALEALTYTCEGQVDLIYIDPPYNTGDRNWKYNNDYVDKNDRYRHSKWLSFMERRLRVAETLLKPNGVLVVTVDENEVSHLGVLLEDLFPNALRQVVTIVINPSGASGDGLSRVEEYAIFCFFGGSLPLRQPDDLLTTEKAGGRAIRWESLMRGGNAWYRERRKNLCYPILLDPGTHMIVDVGNPFPGGDEVKRPKKVGKLLAAWPVRDDGKLGIWRVDAKKLKALASQGYAYTSSANPERGTWTIRYVMSGTVKAIDAGDIASKGILPSGQADLEIQNSLVTVPKTVWYRGRHTAGGAGGTYMVSALLGEKGLFTYPKSLYAVMDTIQVAIGDRKDALILDFFAGSGTTLHAAASLNAQDGGSRRCIAVTNNEVSGEVQDSLLKAGIRPDAAEFAAQGVFELVAKPRCIAALTGQTPSGDPVEGNYEWGEPISDGLAENLLALELQYLDRNELSRGRAFEAIAPLLWLKVGATGPLIAKEKRPFSAPANGRYGILFDISHWNEFAEAIRDRDGLDHVFVVTDSLAQYQQVIAELSPTLRTSMLYEDYLRNFEISCGGAP